MKNIIFCADDYGQNEAISQAIIELLGKKRLSATSCLVTAPNWLNYAQKLVAFKQKVDIGLHFNLTEGIGLSGQISFIPVGHLLLRAYLQCLSLNAIEAELNAQLDHFIKGIGQLPDFIDGHQHIHQFPIIRDAIFKVYEERLRTHGVYIRCVHDPRIFKHFRDNGFSKRLIIELSGARHFKKALARKNIPHNQSFTGIYDFKNAKQYSHFYLSFLNQIEENGLIMFHPGLATDGVTADPIGFARYQEYQYLRSDQFLEANAFHGVILSRGRNI